MAHCWFSVKFTCDRGVSHEFVRHRVMSFAQESTRYCNYTNNKFGSELTFIEPRFWLKNSHEYFKWLKIMEVSENMYNELIAMDSSPQEARSILPISLKTELCMTGRFKDWYNFFLLRSDAAAHPQAIELAAPLLKECKSKYNEFVGLKEVY
jgi:thymidylate synthase (FAD)